MAKEIIYIDIDDDISGIINKVEASKDKVIALVLPKHASVFLSTINMKLLKRSADAQKKSLVLITSDAGLLPLAAVAGIHTAKTLNSKPTLAKIPKANQKAKSATLEDLEDGYEVPSVTPKAQENEVLEIDNSQKITKTITLGPKNRKLVVPNFTSFRLRVFLSIFAFIIVIIGWFVGTVIMPKATVTLKTDVSVVNSSVTLSASTATKEFDSKTTVLPAASIEVKKSDSETVPATGKKDIGTKAIGSMTIYNCTDIDVSIPAGTVFSNSGFSFNLDTDLDVLASDFNSSGVCKKNRSATGLVTAALSGGNSNLSAGREYTSNFASTLTGVGTAMGGGTSKIITVVSNDDIESAKQKLMGKSKSEAMQELKSKLELSDKFVLEDSLSESAPIYTYSAAKDSEVADVTVTSLTTYTMLGVTLDNIKTIIEADIISKITDSQQKILDNGLSSKKLLLIEKKSPSEIKISITVAAIVGPDINIDGIATEILGKSSGEIQRILSSRTGVKEISVHYEPFWVTSTPKKTSKIKVVVEQINAKQ